MTREERKRYLEAVKKVSTEEPYKLDYESLLQQHNTLFFTGQLRPYGNEVGFWNSFIPCKYKLA